MRRIPLAVALASAVAAAGCGGSVSGTKGGGDQAGSGDSFTVTVQNGQGANAVLAIKGGKVVSSPAGIDCGVGATTCSAVFPKGTVVTLTATATVADYSFFYWAGDCAGDAVCTLPSSVADKYVVAVFGKAGERIGHPNWTTPGAHATAYATQVLECSSCHGTNLTGLGIAPSCSMCHEWPKTTDWTIPTPAPKAVTPPVNGIAGIVYDKAGQPVAGAKVYAIPTDHVLADSIYTPPEYDAASAYAVGALVAHDEGVFKALLAHDPAAPVAPAAFASNASWAFVAVVHTPHSFSARNSYKANDLVVVANSVVGPLGEAVNTRFAVYESLVTQVGSADTATGAVTGPSWWNLNKTPNGLNFPATIAPPTSADGDNAAWKFIGLADQMAYFDNLAAFVGAKAYRAGDLVRQAGKVYQAKVGFTSTSTFVAGDWNLLGGLIELAREADVDEPLEGTIRAHGYDATYYATTGADGAYSLAALPAAFADRYYLTVIPSGTTYLPGGDKCRKPLVGATIKGTQVNIEVATAPAASATYVGPSTCLTCHPSQHNAKRTAHALGIKKAFISDVTTSTKPEGGALQNYALFPNWNEALPAFDDAKKLCVTYGTSYKYLLRASTDDCSIIPNIKFSIQLGTDTVTVPGKKFYTATLVNIAGATQWAGANLDGTARADGTYYLELSYGGGIHKQRWLTKIGAQRFTLPIQYNDEGSADETLAGGRLRWQDYTNGDWYNPTTNAPVVTGAFRSFDSMCAGCHFTGYSLDVANNQASAVEEANGDYDYDGDGKLEVMNVTCESCHGPGSSHVAAVSAGKALAIVNPNKLTPERELAICSQCHTRFIGQGGVRSSGVLKTEAPLKDVSGVAVMPRPGISRKDFLNAHVSDIDDGMWDAKLGNGKYSIKHHQQASDFLTTTKYRNMGIPLGGYSVRAGSEGLGTCTGCHDLHGKTGLPRQLVRDHDRQNATSDNVSQTVTLADGSTITVTGSTGTNNGLCNGCHSKSLSGAINTASTSGHNNRGSQTAHNAPNADFTCAACHVPKVAKSGSGAPTGTIDGETYYRGDISSHLFIGVPYMYYAAPSKLSTDAKDKAKVSGAAMMPTPWSGASGSNSCLSCHKKARSNGFNGLF